MVVALVMRRWTNVCPKQAGDRVEKHSKENDAVSVDNVAILLKITGTYQL